MSDRDRLAADLHEMYGCRAGCRSRRVGDRQYEQMHDVADYFPDADRLIALGWTRLDEERLARALSVLPPIPERFLLRKEWVESDWLPNIRDFAAAIAKAYREDTDE